MTISEAEHKSRLGFNVSNFLTPLFSFGLLAIFSLFAWLLITAHSQAQELAILQTDSKLLEQGLHQIAQNTDKISALKTDVSSIKADVSILKTDVSVLKADVNVLKADVSVLKADVSGLRKDVDQHFKVMNARFAEYDKYFVTIIDWIGTRPQTAKNE